MEPSAELRQAYLQMVKEVHPDVTGDDGAMLDKVKQAFAVLDSITNTAEWDAEHADAYIDGLPDWAVELLQGVVWTAECESFSAFLDKEDMKALAVGEMNKKTGVRPWAAAWGKYSQSDANAEALRVCNQNGAKCRLVYVGGRKQRRTVPMSDRPQNLPREDDEVWWNSRFGTKGGREGIVGFGWMPEIDKETERIIGVKTVEYIGGSKVRVPVMRHANGGHPGTGKPYYYSPTKPREKIIVEGNFRYSAKGRQRKRYEFNRMRDIAAKTGNDIWKNQWQDEWDSPAQRLGGAGSRR